MKIRMTKNRRLIHDILQKSTMPLSALEIYDMLKAQGEEIWPSTVYRTLEAFLDHDMVIKAEIPGSDQHHYILAEDSHQHYAVCLSCKQIIDNVSCPIDFYKEDLEKTGFKIVDHRFIIYGYCQACS